MRQQISLREIVAQLSDLERRVLPGGGKFEVRTRVHGAQILIDIHALETLEMRVSVEEFSMLSLPAKSGVIDWAKAIRNVAFPTQYGALEFEVSRSGTKAILHLKEVVTHRHVG